MKMRLLKHLGAGVTLAALLALGGTEIGHAANSVTVASAEVEPGQTNVYIPVFIRNEFKTRQVIVPLLIRKIGPAYVNKVGLKSRGRVHQVLNQVDFANHYSMGTTDTARCKILATTPGAPPGPGGFLGNPYDNDTINMRTVPGTAVPYGIMWSQARIFGADLEPGSDKVASYQIYADINDQQGCFEIDSACINPFNHIGFDRSEINFKVLPNFAQGVIHVGACEGTAVDAVDPASMTHWKGLKDTVFSWDAVDNAMAYEIEIDTVDATFSNLAEHRFLQETQLAYVVPGDTLENKTVYWRVRAMPKDCGYCLGPWSSPATYTDVQTVASSGIPDSYILNQNYPNPFNASTVIEFTNKRDGHVSLQIYNILGQSVATLMDDFKPVGKYAVTWDGTDSRGNVVPSGMYFYRVTTEDFSAVKKMTLLK